MKAATQTTIRLILQMLMDKKVISLDDASELKNNLDAVARQWFDDNHEESASNIQNLSVNLGGDIRDRRAN